MNATNSSDESTAHHPRQQAEHEADADHDLDDRQHMADRRHDRLGQQVIGAYGADAAHRIGELEGARHDPDAAGDQSREETDPLLHAPDPRASA